MSILDKIAENVDYNQIFRKISIWVKICKYLDFGQKKSENFDFGQYLWKSRFWWKLSENLALGHHFWKISILVKIFGTIDLSQHFPQILVSFKISEKMSILVKHQNFRKNSILVKILENMDFWWKFSKNRNSWFWSKFSKIIDFGQNFTKCRF